MLDQFVQKSFVNRGIEFSPLLLLVVLIVCGVPLTAQETQENRSDSPFSGIQFRQIGPFRGGRSGAVTGVQSEPPYTVALTVDGHTETQKFVVKKVQAAYRKTS